MEKFKPSHAKLGSGKRFKHLTEYLSHKPGIKNPKAVAAAIGMKKFGKAKMERMAHAGKK